MDVDNIRLPCTSAEFDRTGESAWEEEWHRAICMPSRFSFQFDFMLCKPKYCLFIAHTGWWGEERYYATLPTPLCQPNCPILFIISWLLLSQMGKEHSPKVGIYHDICTDRCRLLWSRVLCTQHLYVFDVDIKRTARCCCLRFIYVRTLNACYHLPI